MAAPSPHEPLCESAPKYWPTGKCRSLAGSVMSTTLNSAKWLPKPYEPSCFTAESSFCRATAPCRNSARSKMTSSTFTFLNTSLVTEARVFEQQLAQLLAALLQVRG